jgi:type II secretory pathway pseudopilin PulG
MSPAMMYGRGAGGAAGSGMQDEYRQMGGSAGYNGLTAGFPQLESDAYNTSGYRGVFEDPTLGMVPQATMDTYWQQATDNAYDRSRGAYASVFGENGMSPGGVGAQAEMLSRRGRELAETRAGANVENAAAGARTQASARLGISGNRYRVLTDPVEAYYRLQMGGQSGTPTTGQGGYTTVRNPSMGGGGGQSTPGAAQTPWGYQSSGSGLGYPDQTPKPTGGDFWQEPGYPAGPNDTQQPQEQNPYRDIWAYNL